VTTEVSNRQNNFESSALESKRPHFHAPLLTSLCKSALALVESTGLPRLEFIRVESLIFSFSCTLPIPGLANRLWLWSNRHSYYGSSRFESNRSHFHVPPLLSFLTFFHDVFASGRTIQVPQIESIWSLLVGLQLVGQIDPIRVKSQRISRISTQFSSIEPSWRGGGEVFIASTGFWPRGQNPRRHPRILRVYTYKDKEDLLKN